MTEFRTNPGSRSVEEIEREVDIERGRVAETIEALQEKISVDGLIDEVLRSVGEHGGAAGRSLANTVRDNPLPAILTGVGIAWLVAGAGRHDRDDDFDRRGYGLETWEEGDDLYGSAALPPGSYGSEGEGAGAGLAGRAARLGDTAASAAGSVRDGVAELAGRVSSGAGRAGGAARRAGRAARARAGDVRHAARDAGHGLGTMLETQPLVLGALALAVGAAIGGALPRTRTEDDLFGEQSARLRDTVRSAAEEEGRKLRATAGAVADEVKTMAGEAAEAARRSGSEMAERAEDASGAAARRIRDRAAEEAEAQGLGKPSALF